MDDHVADIDQHPVAGRQAFDLGLAIAVVLERAQHVVGQRADVAVRASGGDDEGIGDRRLALQVDADDVLGLLVVETLDNERFEGFQRVPFGAGGPGAALQRVGSSRFQRGNG